MGYDYFAIITIDNENIDNMEECDYEELKDAIEPLAKNITYNDDPVFGDVYHFGSAGIKNFETVWYSTCDTLVTKLLEQFHSYVFSVYVVSFDGETIERITYKYGKTPVKNIITVSVHPEGLTIRPTIDTISIDNNITDLFNTNYCG